MQTNHTSSKIQYKPQDNQTTHLNEEAFIFWLQHYSKFCLILLFYDDIFC